MNRIIFELSHDELVPFLAKQIRWKTKWGKIYWTLNIFLFCTLGYFAFFIGHVSLEQAMIKIGVGFTIYFLMIPIHEAIHGLVYRFLGAKNITFKAVWRNLIFYAVADKFIANRKQFNLVALAPFIILNTALIVLFFISDSPTNLIYYGAIILHTGGCFGDFALISFMHEHRIVSTMDDLPNERTLFFKL